MKRSPVYLRWREETLEEGIQQGIQQTEQRIKQQVIENLLTFRFGSLDSELLAIMEPVLLLSLEEFTPLLLTASREELLERFGE
ncbi:MULTISPECIES: hypothetical protein [unclassified Okeania]|uniref:hypothetical protein n=1 Tax=unclassified Okeania TaxID=2634635 RepID=UPI0014294D26|nr:MULTISPECIES: hypothetical protein [unclassified Okeania]NES89781.1 hypothetical protein [Okeania sp. SIO2B9]NET76726.1 hypothetical protein [Okeania sp. SIO1F9]